MAFLDIIPYLQTWYWYWSQDENVVSFYGAYADRIIKVAETTVLYTSNIKVCRGSIYDTFAENKDLERECGYDVDSRVDTSEIYKPFFNSFDGEYGVRRWWTWESS